MTARADLHVHSKYSDNPTEWILKKLGSPECFTEPEHIYHTCRERGMDFVTISDHDTIDGALEIAHLPGTFISCEVTASFPQDEAQIHLLVIGITEQQFKIIDSLRNDLYQLAFYLRQERILHSVAHALFRVNTAFSVDHFEKLLLLFDRFEGINGTRDPRACTMVQAILQSLTAEDLAVMAERQGLEPLMMRPWIKHFTGGSDDHSGLYIASAYTETPDAERVEDFLGHLRRGRHLPGGVHGDSLRLGRSFSSIGRLWNRRRREQTSAAAQSTGGERFEDLLNMMLDGEVPDSLKPSKSIISLARTTLVGALGGEHSSGVTSILSRGDLQEISRTLAGRRALPETEDSAPASFRSAATLSHRLGQRTVQRMLESLLSGNLFAALESLPKLAPAALAATPYLAAFITQHKDEKFIQQIAERFPAAAPMRHKSERKAWFTDTLTEINGVARTVRTAAGAACHSGRELQVISCFEGEQLEGFDHLNFTPVDTFELPEYRSQQLAFPPLLDIVRHCEEKAFDEVVLSTPGPVGVAGLLAARLLNLRVTGIYHTDFPVYVRHLTGSATLERSAWAFMRWFFNGMDVLYVPSQAYLDDLAARGFDGTELRIMPRGVDRELFAPGRREPGFWGSRGLPERHFRFLNVGRVSKEKNLDVLFESFRQLREEGLAATLSIVGEGPYLEELKERYSGPDTLFTGTLEGEELARAYASADAFVFPSRTDTFGNAVLEACASGIPVIVSNEGGPREIVAPHDAGLIVDVTAPDRLTQAMRDIAGQQELRRQLSRMGLKTAREHTWEAFLSDLWSPAGTAAEKLPLPAEQVEENLTAIA
ncbi:MAG: glycosyltransferase [Acidobacteriota bacterium]